MRKKLQMNVSSIYSNGGKKYAYISFEDGDKKADGKIPDCTIVFNKGFDEKEVKALELYMKMNLEELKEVAAGIRMIDAFLK